MQLAPDSGSEELLTRVADAMTRRGWMLATVESCTGGLIAVAATSVAGSSAWFDRAFVTYSNEAKSDLVGVTPGTIASYGAVSEETAIEMAAGGLARSKASICVAVTGVAGPGGGSPAKPVGTVCFAWATVTEVRSERVLFAGDRASIRSQAVAHALAGAVSIADVRR